MSHNPIIFLLLPEFSSSCLGGFIFDDSSRSLEWILGLIFVVIVCVASTAGSVSRRRGGGKHPTPSRERRIEQAHGPRSKIRVDNEEDLTGRWQGTVRIWPVGPRDDLRVYPLRIVIRQGGKDVDVESTGSAEGRGRVVSAELLEQDAFGQNVDTRLVVKAAGREEAFVAPLRRQGGRLVSEDESARVTVELQRGERRERGAGVEEDAMVVT